ncbi:MULTISPECIES: LysE family translocator [Mycolicibacterium]|uniref:Lysine exporter protein (LYSE/YGGA) n=1 Tax=Mycolicibacterium vanbaalenii (strain DSM 7251 / JCM 13017 / BCRC 16820 / KCTC 9966 / NRRL B-24157 / PYR-1) TaxID=350058 RepID=A1T1H3_MYCVP|nr:MULTISPECIES: LysE family translocator [Mycolicibacterium]ABM11023.1 Lysine exporter protein (LYSE/YGGA) [Mycolicibacterium vanbaalenii PYR-1]MCV7128241.1 LysE family translocator [Mycolicibacterium vanbaalenii PYR-1]MDW5610152.1 LysE family translocator [Mycolicibacterium sp. D5.8-2]QZT57205.1 LysE family translocator [Mycolicibacterium austroafricanum]UJL29845.1 LysE family translocator [Mycolicibacterium vanbaalenii]
MTLAFLLTSLVIVATPGTGALYTIATGLAHGTRASVVAAVGCTIGIVPAMLAAVTGLAAILHSSAIAFQTIKWLGVGYLLYLAWITWRDKTELVADAVSSERPGSWRITGTAVAVNVLNPKLTIFFFAFLPQFVDPARPPVLQMLYLSAIFMAMTLVVFALYGAFAAGVRTHVISRPRVVTWMRRTFAATYVALAARMAVTTR